MVNKEILDRKIYMRAARFLHRKTEQYIKNQYKKLQDQENNKWNNLFLNDRKFTFQLEEDVKINLYKDSILSRLIYDDVFECEEVKFIKSLLKKGDTFIDVGANIGFFTLIASLIVESEGKIYSFEPTPETYRRLVENIEINSFKNIYPQQLALSNGVEKLSFHVSENGYDAWNSFVMLDRHENAKVIEVDTLLLDTFLSEKKIQPESIKLIKIDVEGWEFNVFRGASNLLQDPNAPVLMVEFTDVNAFAAGYYCGELYDYIEQFGYKWYKYDALNNQLIPDKKRLHYPYENLFAVKNIEKTNKELSD